MRRTGTVALVVALVLLAGTPLPTAGAEAGTAVLGGPTAWAQTGTTTPGPSDGAPNGSSAAAPGTRLAGAVGAQGAELGGELEARSLAHQLNRSGSPDARAAVIARQATQIRTRLTTLRTASERLEAARANGTVSETEYRVRAAQLSAQVVAVQRVTGRSSAVARELPEAALRRNGVNASTLQSLQRDADTLVGPAMSAAAREVAGPRVGSGFGPDSAGDRGRGPPDDPGGGPPDRARDGGPGEQRPAGDPGDPGGPRTGNATDDGTPSRPNGQNDSDGSDRSGGQDGSDQSGGQGGQDGSDQSGGQGGQDGSDRSDGRNEGDGRDNDGSRGTQS